MMSNKKNLTPFQNENAQSGFKDENGEVVIRPSMYVALSYDQRIIDGRESVGFLVKVKEMLENPERMLFGSKDPHAVLLGL